MMTKRGNMQKALKTQLVHSNSHCILLSTIAIILLVVFAVIIINIQAVNMLK
jgi:hypothetical protein